MYSLALGKGQTVNGQVFEERVFKLVKTNILKYTPQQQIQSRKFQGLNPVKDLIYISRFV